jgi:hypothetical protein
MSARTRREARLVPITLRMRRAARRWETLVADAAIDDADDRLRTKLAKSRKLHWRLERRAVRRLLRGTRPERSSRLRRRLGVGW